MLFEALGEGLAAGDILGDTSGDTSGDTFGDIEALGEGEAAGGPQATSRNANAMTSTSNVRIVVFFMFESPPLLYAPIYNRICIILTWQNNEITLCFIAFARTYFSPFAIIEPYQFLQLCKYAAAKHDFSACCPLHFA
jgi:hypothetical protein